MESGICEAGDFNWDFGELSSKALECDGLASLWPRSDVIDNKAALGRRTPKKLVRF